MAGFVTFTICIFGAAPATVAQEVAVEASRATEGWVVMAGAFDLVDLSIAEAGIEYRFPALMIKNIPIAIATGVSGNRDGGGWVYGTFRYNYPFAKRWIVSPQSGVSLYENGDGKDLGGPIEFRSGLEISVEVGPGRLGLLFYHLSNANIYDENPGANTIVLQWTLGRRVFGRR